MSDLRQCLCFDTGNHKRYWRQRCVASCGRPASRARRVWRLCKVIQQVMREEQAITDSRFSRYVGHSGGGLFCVFSSPCLFLCCLPLSSFNQLFASFISGCLIVLALLFIFLSCDRPPLWLSHTTLYKVGNRNREIRNERNWQWRQHLYLLSCFFQPLHRLVKGLPLVVFPPAFETYVANLSPSVPFAF